MVDVRIYWESLCIRHRSGELAPSRFLIGSGKVYAVRGLHRRSSIQGDRVISTVILTYDVTLRARRMEKVGGNGKCKGSRRRSYR